MADPINHDGFSTAATVGGKAVKWGLLGAIAAFAIPAVVIGGAGLLAGAAISALATGGIMGGIASVAGLLVSAAGVVGGVVAGVSSAASFGGGAAVVGGALGAVKGVGQVVDENSAYRNRGQGKQNTRAKTFNDGEIKGIQEGYQIAKSDIEPQIQKREQVAFQKGQEFVVNQIQEHMSAQMAAGADPKGQQAAAAAAGGFAGKEIELKCESKAKAVLKQREVEAMMPKQL